MIRILGIDPGYAIVGWGIVDSASGGFKTPGFGAVTTDAGTPFGRRLEMIYDGITQVIEKYSPDAMAIEKLFFNTNTTTAIDVAQARGCIMLAAVKSGIPVYEYTPLQVKQAVTGHGRAAKAQVMYMTKMLLGLKETPKPDDTADALAMAICHGYVSGSLMTRLKGVK